MCQIAEALGKSLAEVKELDAAELAVWRAKFEEDEEREIARTAAAIHRFWSGETKWRAEHYLRPPDENQTVTEDELWYSMASLTGMKEIEYGQEE